MVKVYPTYRSRSLASCFLALAAVLLSFGNWILGPYSAISELGLFVLAVVVVTRFFGVDEVGRSPYPAAAGLVFAYVVLVQVLLYALGVKITRLSIVCSIDTALLVCALLCGLFAYWAVTSKNQTSGNDLGPDDVP
jgi:hypothetical protein